MKQLELVIRNQTGLHARPAKVLVNLAKQFKADISIHCKQKRANAKSMVSVLTLGATCGSAISIQANGEDEELALAKLEEAIAAGLGDVDHAETQMEPPVAAPEEGKAESLQPDARGALKGVPAAPGIAAAAAYLLRPINVPRTTPTTVPIAKPVTARAAVSFI